MPAISVEHVGQRYIARVSYADREIAKSAGFRWDGLKKHWYTTQPEVAAKLASADAQQTMLAEAARLKAAKQEQIDLSRARDADVAIPVPEGKAYLPYQRAGIACALGRTNVLFGDDMGLGKTIQGIGILNADESLKRVLVICPASLLYNWQRECRGWSVRKLNIGIATGKYWPSTDVVLINYDILTKHTAKLHGEVWDAVIIDEAHYLKNPKAQRTVAVVGKEAIKGDPAVEGIKARRRIALTGTPIPNRPIEAWSIIHYLDPENYRSFFGYAKQFCNAFQHAHGWDFSGASHLAELQDKLRSTIMIRRRKADVLTELPAKRRVLVELPPDGCEEVLQDENDSWEAQEAEIETLRVAVELAKAEGREKYEAAVDALRQRTQLAFTELSKLRHQTAVAKIPAVIEHLEAALNGDEDHKVVLFAHHKDVVAAIMEALASREISAVKVTGDTGLMERQANVDKFQRDSNCRVFVGNIQAAGVGITLTAAAHVIFAELDWVPGNVTQAEDRCHRIGQRDSVLVEHLVLDGSLDARMARTLIAKQYVIDAALDNERPALAAEPEAPTKDRAATQDLTVDKLAKIADRMTPELCAVMIQGLQILAGLDGDFARDQNGVGFGRMDVRIGHSLAERGSLSPRQGALAAKLCNKYRRQLPDSIGEAAKAALQ